MSQVRSVTIPACEQHEGYPGNAITIRLHWICPVCGGERGGWRKIHISKLIQPKKDEVARKDDTSVELEGPV